MKMMNRYAIVLSEDKKDKIDIILSNIRTKGGVVASVSCSKNEYLIIYRSEEEFDKEELMK